MSFAEILEVPNDEDGAWQPWTEWSGCTKSCGSGTRLRSRICKHPAGNGHPGCLEQGHGTEIQPCGELPCKEKGK